MDRKRASRWSSWRRARSLSLFCLSVAAGCLTFSTVASSQAFTIQNRPVGVFADWAATSGVEVVTGDFNGDRRTDIGLVRQEPGWSTIPVALSTNDGFIIQNRPVGDFAGWATESGVEVVTGDFNRDRRTDIGLVRQEPGWGSVPLALSRDNSFIIQNPPVGDFAVWAATSGVLVLTGDFNGDGRTDIALVRRNPAGTRCR
jgi:serralysin